jgi:hypothetical protein
MGSSRVFISSSKAQRALQSTVRDPPRNTARETDWMPGRAPEHFSSQRDIDYYCHQESQSCGSVTSLRGLLSNIKYETPQIEHNFVHVTILLRRGHLLPQPTYQFSHLSASSSRKRKISARISLHPTQVSTPRLNWPHHEYEVGPIPSGTFREILALLRGGLYKICQPVSCL